MTFRDLRANLNILLDPSNKDILVRDVFEVLKLSPIKTFKNAKHSRDRAKGHAI